MELCSGIQAWYRTSLNMKVRGFVRNVSDHQDRVSSSLHLPSLPDSHFLGLATGLYVWNITCSVKLYQCRTVVGTWPKLGHVLTSQRELLLGQKEQVDLSWSDCLSKHKSLEVLGIVPHREDWEAGKSEILQERIKHVHRKSRNWFFLPAYVWDPVAISTLSSVRCSRMAPFGKELARTGFVSHRVLEVLNNIGTKEDTVAKSWISLLIKSQHPN